MPPTADQITAALERASAVRVGRARILRAIRAGALPWEAALDDDACATLRIAQLLANVPRIGAKRAAYVLDNLDPPMPHDLQARHISPARRAALRAALTASLPRRVSA